jgi:hypothetical protein
MSSSPKPYPLLIILQISHPKHLVLSIIEGATRHPFCMGLGHIWRVKRIAGVPADLKNTKWWQLPKKLCFDGICRLRHKLLNHGPG